MKGPLPKPLNQLFQNMSNGSLGYKDLREAGTAPRQSPKPSDTTQGSKSPLPNRIVGRTPSKTTTPKPYPARNMRIVVHDVDSADAIDPFSDSKKILPASSQPRKNTSSISRIKNELEVINLEPTNDKKSKIKSEGKKEELSVNNRHDGKLSARNLHEKSAYSGGWSGSPRGKIQNQHHSFNESRYNQERLILDIKSAAKSKFTGQSQPSTSSFLGNHYSDPQGKGGQNSLASNEQKEQKIPKVGRFRMTILSLIAQNHRPFDLTDKPQWSFDEISNSEVSEDNRKEPRSEFKMALLSAFKSNLRFIFQKHAVAKMSPLADCKLEEAGADPVEPAIYNKWMDFANTYQGEDESDSQSEDLRFQDDEEPWLGQQVQSGEEFASGLQTPDTRNNVNDYYEQSNGGELGAMGVEEQADLYRVGVEVISSEDLNSANRVYEKIIAKKNNEEINKKFQELLDGSKMYPQVAYMPRGVKNYTGVSVESQPKRRGRVLVRDPESAMFGVDEYYESAGTILAGHLDFFSTN